MAGGVSALLGLAQFIIGGAAAPLVGVAGGRTAVPMGVVIAVLTLTASLCYSTLTRGHRPIG